MEEHYVNQRFLRMSQAAKFAGLNRKTIYKMLEAGDLDGEKTSGGHWRVDRESIEKYFSRDRKALAMIGDFGL